MMTRKEFEGKLHKLAHFLEDEGLYLEGDYGGEIYVSATGSRGMLTEDFDQDKWLNTKKVREGV